MISRIKALIEAATPGPWRTSPMFPSGVISEPTDSVVATIEEWSDEIDAADAAFIAHARQLLPLMADVVRIAELVAWEDEPIDSNHVLLSEYLGALDAYCAEHLPEKEEK